MNGGCISESPCRGLLGCSMPKNKRRGRLRQWTFVITLMVLLMNCREALACRATRIMAGQGLPTED